MLILARIAIPVTAAGLLLTACGSGARPGTLEQASTTRAAAAVTLDAATQATRPTASVRRVPTAAAGTSTITTRGVGKASGTPDTLTVVIGVSTQASSAKAALDSNNAKAKALIDLLHGNGVADKDVQTSQLSINPTYNDKSGAISGYQVDDTVQATLHNVGNAGALLDAAVGAVGNAVRVQQIGFSVGDDSTLLSQARSQAVTRAKAQAAQIAQAAGLTLGRIRSITEVADTNPPVNYDVQAPAASAAAVPVQAGLQDVTVSVDIVYETS